MKLRNLRRSELRRIQFTKLALWLGFEILGYLACAAFAAVLAWQVWRAFYFTY